MRTYTVILDGVPDDGANCSSSTITDGSLRLIPVRDSE